MAGSRRWLGGVALLVAVGVAWLWWPHRDVAPPLVQVGQGGAPTNDVVSGRIAADARDAAFAGHDVAVREPGAVVPAEPEQRFWCEVRDAVDNPVAGATVEIWPARGEARTPDVDDARAMVWLGPDRSGIPLTSGTTDADGRCEFAVASERVYATASHQDLGRSIPRAVGLYELGSYRVLSLFLLRPVTIRGIVLDADTRPLPFAIVRDASLERPLGKMQPTGEIAAGSDGRFAVEVAVGARCKLSARHGSVETTPVELIATADVDVILAVPGAFTIRAACPIPGAAMRLDATPQPVGLTPPLLAVPSSVGKVSRGASEAEVCVPLPGTYRVDATVWSGDQDLAILDVVTRPSSRAANGGIWRATTVDVVVTFADPHPKIVLGGLDEVAIRWGTKSMPHATIIGAVFLPDGQPCTEFELKWSGGHLLSQRASAQATTDGNTFRFDGEVPFEGATLVVCPKGHGLAAQILGPFPDGGQHEFVVRIPAGAEVRVHAFVHGRPARAVTVQFTARDGSADAKGVVAADGTVLLRVASHGPGKLCLLRDREVLRELDVDLQPGLNRDIVLDLQL